MTFDEAIDYCRSNTDKKLRVMGMQPPFIVIIAVTDNGEIIDRNIKGIKKLHPNLKQHAVAIRFEDDVSLLKSRLTQGLATLQAGIEKQCSS